MNSAIFTAFLLGAPFLAAAALAAPGAAPPLPMAGTRIVNVASEAQLQAAMGGLRDGDTLLLADGTYRLSRSLYVQNRRNVTIRGAAGTGGVVLMGKGMDNARHGGVPFGIWSNSANTTIAHVTIRDTYDNAIIFNAGAQAPHVYSVSLLNAGSQFIKSNPTDVKAGLGVNQGRVEHCRFEYTHGPPGDHGAGTGYFNGISAHAARDWIVRGNLFKNLHNPDQADYLWNPAVLFWGRSANTVTEQNTFINVDRAIAYGLENTAAHSDHEAGIIRNNFVYLEPGLMSARRKASSDGAIIAWNSPGTQIDHNTVLVNGNVFFAVQFRFASTKGGAARNNLADAPVHLRDGARASLSGNLPRAQPGFFVDPARADLRLRRSATEAIDQAPLLESVTDDIDGEPRPQGAGTDIGADEFSASRPPVITAFELAGADCMIRFNTVPGQSYEVERAGDLLREDWALVKKNISGTGASVLVTDPNAAARARLFYRVRLSP